MSARALPVELVFSDPSVRNGRPIIAGTTLCVSDLVAWHKAESLSPEQLALQFDLTLAHVYAALAYYHQNRVDIDAEIRANESEADHWRKVLTEQGRC